MQVHLVDLDLKLMSRIALEDISGQLCLLCGQNYAAARPRQAMHGLHYFCAPCLQREIEVAEEKEYYRMINGESTPAMNSPFLRCWYKPERPLIHCRLCGFLVIAPHFY